MNRIVFVLGKRLGVLVAAAMLLVSIDASAAQPEVSGRIENGLRILAIKPSAEPVNHTVYRGDYIKFALDPAMPPSRLQIPALNIDQMIGTAADDPPYLKMKATGRFAYRLGTIEGRIEVIAYQQAAYREMDSKAAKAFIANDQPLILDVRTPREFQQGHLGQARLIPVQQLARRWQELAEYKNKEVLIYCATGNRSTVAAKILIDQGFQHIYNMRYGIYDWSKRGYPVVK